MIDATAIALVAASSAASASLAAWWSGRAARRAADIRREADREQWRRSERRLREHHGLIERQLDEAQAREALLVRLGGTPAAIPGRVTARWAQDMAGSLRGLADITSATVSGADGLPLTRSQSEATRRAGSATTWLERAAATAALGGLVAVDVVTERAAGWAFRRLSHDERSPWLVAESSRGPVNPVALDVVVASSGLPYGVPPAASIEERLVADEASADELGAWLHDACSRATTRDLAVIAGEAMVAHGSRRGLGEARLSSLVEPCLALSRALDHALPDAIASLRLTLAGGVVVTLEPVAEAAGHHLMAVTTNGALDELALRRITGRVRRHLVTLSPAVGAAS